MAYSLKAYAGYDVTRTSNRGGNPSLTQRPQMSVGWSTVGATGVGQNGNRGRAGGGPWAKRGR